MLNVQIIINKHIFDFVLFDQVSGVGTCDHAAPVFQICQLSCTCLQPCQIIWTCVQTWLLSMTRLHTWLLYWTSVQYAVHDTSASMTAVLDMCTDMHDFLDMCTVMSAVLDIYAAMALSCIFVKTCLLSYGHVYIPDGCPGPSLLYWTCLTTCLIFLTRIQLCSCLRVYIPDCCLGNG